MNEFIVKQMIYESSVPKSYRNRMGQYATPEAMADSLADIAKAYITDSNMPIRFIDPAFGFGSLWNSVIKKFGIQQLSGCGIEAEDSIFKEVVKIWKDTPIKFLSGDFSKISPPDKKYDLLIANPPYVRHHHIDRENKIRLKSLVKRNLGISPSGYLGLYGYFILLSHEWLVEDGLAVWLIPREFLDVGYGISIKEYLKTEVSLLRVHLFDHCVSKFDGALVTSAIVVYKKNKPDGTNTVKFSYGDFEYGCNNGVDIPIADLNPKLKWSNISSSTLSGRNTVFSKEGVKFSDLFKISRGIATGANKFFILSESEATAHQIPSEFLQPILPSPRYLKTDRVTSDSDGLPNNTERLFLINCSLDEIEIREKYPMLWRYFSLGIEDKVNESTLCSSRRRWYQQEKREPPPILISYMSRSKSADDTNPFRFILNQSRAVAGNSYLLLYPKQILRDLLDSSDLAYEKLWEILQGMRKYDFLTQGRTYGGGLHKIEPSELGNVDAEIVLTRIREATRVNI